MTLLEKEHCCELLHSCFEANALRFPERIAIESGQQKISYHDLNTRANQLAAFIHDSFEIETESKVIILIKDRLLHVIAVIALMKLGGASVQVDPNWPADRILTIVDDCKSSLIFHDHILNESLTTLNAGYLNLNDKRVKQCLPTLPSDNPNIETNVPASPKRLCTILYTSGSTGKPKGVMLEHHSIYNLAFSPDFVEINEHDRIAFITNTTFDASLFEVWGALLNGATLVCSPTTVLQSIDTYVEFLQSKSISILFCTTSLFHAIAALKPESFHKLRALIFGGEVVNPESVISLFETGLPAPRHIINVYGPTENTTISTYLDIKSKPSNKEPLPIGKFLRGVNGLILDVHKNICPPGEVGELYLSGDGLARGYVKTDKSSQNKFFFDKEAGCQFYRTGDLVRYKEADLLEFIGRIDNQIKLRGFRIELGEIESTLLSHPEISLAAVLPKTKDNITQYLIAYLEFKEESSLDTTPSYWEAVFNNLYTSGIKDESQNIMDFSGWESSFTQDKIPQTEMEEWRNKTIERICLLEPKHVLEIGCGSGLLMFPLLERCESYQGTDLSESVIHRLQLMVKGKAKIPVNLVKSSAIDYVRAQKKQDNLNIDTIILNSVITYFPNAEYLTEVLTALTQRISKGSIFIGDIRDLRLQSCFYAEIARTKNPEASAEEIETFTESHINSETELLLDPRYFLDLQIKIPAITHVELLPKRGIAQHQMNRYRYDAVLTIGQTNKPFEEANWHKWEAKFNLEEMLERNKQDNFGILGYPNIRIHEEYALYHNTASAQDDNYQIRTLEELFELAEQYNYALSVQLNLEHADLLNFVFSQEERHFNAFYSNTKTNAKLPLTNSPIVPDHHDLESIQQYLSLKLPKYMIPSQLIPLEKMPLTSSGKIDREALKSIMQPLDKSSTCIDSIHYDLIRLWEKAFAYPSIPPKANFYSLGGNSIVAIQLIHLINEIFNLELAIAWIYLHPDIEQQAEAIRNMSPRHACYQPIIAFNAAGKTHPLYMVHPGLIGAECYAQFAHLLDRSINCYGIDSYNFYHDPMKSSVNELSAYYAEMLIASTTSRNLYLGGWSLGGLIAYEIAIRLKKAGFNVLKLFLIEPDSPDYTNPKLNSGEKIDVNKLTSTPQYITDYLMQLPQALSLRIIENLGHDVSLSENFHPSETIDCPVIIFKAESDAEKSELLGEQMPLIEAWEPYIHDLTAVDIPGDHFSLMDGAGLQMITQYISDNIICNESKDTQL